MKLFPVLMPGARVYLKELCLLQVMLPKRSYLIYPVHERSKVCLFDKFCTILGYNQSIENHFSTYIRLKKHELFLRSATIKTLFLKSWKFGKEVTAEWAVA